MTTTGRWVMYGALAGLLASGIAATAQAPAAAGRAQRRAGGAVALATVPADVLGKALSLKPEQTTKIAEIQEKYRADVKPLRPARGVEQDPAARLKIADLTRQANADIQAVLTDEQKANLREVTRELAALRAAGIPLQVVADLKLTPEQKEKIAGIMRDTQEKLRGMAPADRQQKRREMMLEVRTKVSDLLTADQKKVIEQWTQERRRARGRNRGT